MDVRDLPARATLTIEQSGCCSPAIELRPSEGDAVDLTAARSVWWRRPQIADTSAVTDVDARIFAAGEWHEAVTGAWNLLTAAWMNPPAADEIASHKAYQLRVATEVGLRVPRTLMTSDPARAREFIQARALGQTVFKTFSCTHQVWRETRPVRSDEMLNLDTVRLAPVIFQEYIAADRDVRVTVVGDQIFAAAINSADADYRYDFRMVLGQAKVEAIDLPARLAETIRRFIRRLGLIYGAIDLRRTPDGEYVFLEINTAGEFLFIEERTALPITAAVADWLTKPSVPSPARAVAHHVGPRNELS